MDELLRVARKFGLRVRIEPFEIPGVHAGGLCRVRGRQLILLDQKASVVDRVGALAEALAGFDLETVYVAPEARQLIEATLARRRESDQQAERPTSLNGSVGASAAHPQIGSAEVHQLLVPKPGLRSTADRAPRNGEDDE